MGWVWEWYRPDGATGRGRVGDRKEKLFTDVGYVMDYEEFYGG